MNVQYHYAWEGYLPVTKPTTTQLVEVDVARASHK